MSKSPTADQLPPPGPSNVVIVDPAGYALHCFWRALVRFWQRPSRWGTTPGMTPTIPVTKPPPPPPVPPFRGGEL